MSINVGSLAEDQVVLNDFCARFKSIQGRCLETEKAGIWWMRLCRPYTGPLEIVDGTHHCISANAASKLVRSSCEGWSKIRRKGGSEGNISCGLGSTPSALRITSFRARVTTPARTTRFRREEVSKGSFSGRVAGVHLGSIELSAR